MSDITFECSHCSQTISIDETARGTSVKCPTCVGNITVPNLPPLMLSKPAAIILSLELNPSDMPPVVAGGMRGFLSLGSLALIFGPILLMFLISENEKGALTFIFAGAMFVWGILALLVAYGIKNRRPWSHPVGVCLAIMMLCSLLVFIVAPPGMVGALLMVIAGVSVGPGISMLVGLSKGDWRSWCSA